MYKLFKLSYIFKGVATVGTSLMHSYSHFGISQELDGFRRCQDDYCWATAPVRLYIQSVKYNDDEGSCELEQGALSVCVCV